MIQITQEGYNKLREELDYREKVLRKKIAEKIREAKELGDLSENAAYKEAQEEAALNEAQIQKIREKLASAEIIDDPGPQKGVVRIGSRVMVRKVGQKHTREFLIVGSDEADPRAGKISSSSPLGGALIGKKTGSKIEVETPQGKVKYVITKIE